MGRGTMFKKGKIHGKGIIYRLISPCGKSYIGQTRQILANRMRYHKNNAKKENPSCPHLAAAINKYGFDNFKIEVLVECEWDMLDYYEVKFINLFDSIENGYNLAIGGQGGVRPPIDPAYVNRHEAAEPTKERETISDEKIQELIKKDKPTTHGAVRKHTQYDLPQYVTFFDRKTSNPDENGFIVKMPDGRRRTFAKMSMTMDEKYREAMKCYHDFKSGKDYQRVSERKRYNDDKLSVPIGIVRRGDYGFAFDYRPKFAKTKSFLKLKKTRRQNLISALEHWMKTVPREGNEVDWASVQSIYDSTVYDEKMAQQRLARIEKIQYEISVYEKYMNLFTYEENEDLWEQVQDQHDELVQELAAISYE